MTIRLLDPPLHEFLPKREIDDSQSFTYEEELMELAAKLGISLEVCLVGTPLLYSTIFYSCPQSHCTCSPA